jgi:DNA-binding NarL/FixJ family response regulator
VSADPSAVHRNAASSQLFPAPESAGAGLTILGAYLTPTLKFTLLENRVLQFIGSCDEQLEIIRMLKQFQPSLLLISRPVELSALIAVLRQAKEIAATTKTLIVADSWDSELMRAMLRYGAKGCVRTTCSPQNLAKALLAVYAGDVWFERKILIDAIDQLLKVVNDAVPGVRPQMTESQDSLVLTKREHAVAELLIQGLTNKEIGKRLNISIETVKTHLKSIFAKLGIQRRSQVVLKTLCDRIVLP